MKVSIITICFNSAETIRDTIGSVVGQYYDKIEYIIVDGQSSDNTLSIVNEYKHHIARIISEKDNGLYDAINKGIRAATGEIVGLIHADDILADSSVVSKIVEKFSETHCQATYSDLQYVKRNNTDTVFRNWISGEYDPILFKKGWMPPHPTFYARKELFEEFGYYNTTFTSSADYELMLRFMYKNQIKVAYIPQVLVKMRVGGKSNASLKNRIIANMEDRKAWEINKLKPNLFTLFLKPLLKIKQLFS